jgi:2-haloacid dehalogenase
LFDLGGVVIHWDPGVAYREAFAQAPDLVDRFLAGPLAELGAISCETPGSLAAMIRPFAERDPELVPLLEYFAGHWPTFVRGAIGPSVRLLERLRAARVPLYGLTNWPQATYPPRGPEFEFLDWFEGVVVSGAEGVRKPGVAIFERTIERFALDPRATVYVDDHPGNVETAAHLGFRAHRFESAPGLETFLVEQGLLPAPCES